ncbi:MAG: glycosyltransferase family 2 protein [Candidatus Omnitrophota bacterium]|nr:MAG: glycosyltransferase family 2 protein [Candidatus Omnitrophota bacterium]
MKLSVVIPCYNEAEGVTQLASKLKEFEQNFTDRYELIFVDDGSSDSTYEELTRLYKDRSGKDVKVIKHLENRGVGAALKLGILSSEGDYVAAIDSDCTYEPVYLVEMFDIIRREKADIVTTSPYHPEGSTIGVPGYRLFLSRNLSNLYSFLLKSKFYTYTSMFRIYRRDTIKNIDFKSDSFLAMAEILIKAHKKGFKVIEHPATLKSREFGASNAKTLKMIKEHLCFIFKLLVGKE